MFHFQRTFLGSRTLRQFRRVLVRQKLVILLFDMAIATKVRRAPTEEGAETAAEATLVLNKVLAVFGALFGTES